MDLEKGIDELVKDAEQLFDNGKYGECALLFREIVENTNDDKHLSTAYFYFGQVSGAQGDMDAEKFWYNIAIEKNQLNSHAYDALASVYEELGDEKKSQELFDRALEINQMRAKSRGEGQR